MLAFHRRLCAANGGILTMGLMHAPNPSACGSAQMDRSCRITEIVEKPQNPESDLANAGVYVTFAAIFEAVKKPRFKDSQIVFDFGFQVLSALRGRMYGYDSEKVPRGLSAVNGLTRPRDLTMDIALAKRILKIKLGSVDEVVADYGSRIGSFGSI